MLKQTLLRYDQYPIQKWKNGHGETREIARSEREPFLWRLSLATLQKRNEFSLYPDYTRWIVFLGKDPVVVQHPLQERERSVSPFNAYRFRGDAPTLAITPSETCDFNVMTRDAGVKASVHCLTGKKGEQIQFPLNGQEHFVFVAQGSYLLENRAENTQAELKRFDACRIERHSNKEYLALRSEGLEDLNTVIWVTIHVP